MKIEDSGRASITASLLVIGICCSGQLHAENEITTKLQVSPGNPIKIQATDLVNEHYSPVNTPCHNKVRGLALSGNGQLLKIYKEGSINVDKQTLHWKCRFILTEGTTLITALGKPILVSAGDLNVFLDQGTTAVVHLSNGVTRCANMTDQHQGSMKILYGKYFHDVAPGRETVFVKGKQKEAQELAHCDGIGWRDLHSSTIDDTSIISYKIRSRDMLKRMKIYQQLHESPLAEDHQLCEELMKSAAALETMYIKKQGPYLVTDPYKYKKQESKQIADDGAKAI